MSIRKVVVREILTILMLGIIFGAILFLLPRYIPNDEPYKVYTEDELMRLGVIVTNPQELINVRQNEYVKLAGKILSVDESTRKLIARTTLFGRKHIPIPNQWRWSPKGENLGAFQDLKRFNNEELAWVGDVSLKKLKTLEKPSFFWTNILLSAYQIAFWLFPLYIFYCFIQIIIWQSKRGKKVEPQKRSKCKERNNPALTKCWKCGSPLESERSVL